MVKIPVKIRLGAKLSEEGEQLLEIIDELYEDISENLNQKPQLVIESDTAPTTSDHLHNIGTLWLNQDTSGGSPTLYQLATKSGSTATWIALN